MLPEYCIVEYCGIQRCGKSTLMTADILCKDLNPEYAFGYIPQDVYANYKIDIKGINCGDNERMLWWLTMARKEKWRHKVFAVDECSQPPLFYARNTRDKIQTELVTSLWQMPKLGCMFHYSSNIGNSVDIQQRDATWLTIMPKYFKHEDRSLDYIDYRVIHAYECWVSDETFLHPEWIQNYFESLEPVV